MNDIFANNCYDENDDFWRDDLKQDGPPQNPSLPPFPDFFSAENVAIIVSLVSAAIGVTTTAIKAIQLWLDEKKSRKISIKYQDFEISIAGSMNEKEILSKLKIFNQIRKEIKKEDVNIILLDDPNHIQIK